MNIIKKGQKASELYDSALMQEALKRNELDLAFIDNVSTVY